MDKTAINAEAALINAAQNTARNLGLDFDVLNLQPQLGPRRADALVRIGRNVEGAQYAVEIKKAVHPATLGPLLLQLGQLGQQALLITEYITPPMADTLRDKGVAFIDAAGNAYLNQPNLLIWVTGRKPVEKRIDPQTGRGFQPTGLQVVFALLCNPEWVNRPYRELAEKAKVAHGTVGWVMPDLQRQGFLADIKGKRGTRRLYKQPEMLAQWVDAYARQLRPKTLLARYYVETLNGWKDWPLHEHGALWGGEPAGALLTEYLRPGELTIYADKVPVMLAAKYKFLKEPRPGHTDIVEIRKPFWNFPGHPEHTNVVPPILVYADLLATGDGRCIETAKMVHEQYLDRPLQQA